MSLNSVSPLVDACPTGTRLRYKSLAVLLLLHIFVIGICVFKAFDISWKTHTNPPITGPMVRWAFAFARCLGLCYTIGANYELFHKRFMISYLKLSEKLFFTNLNVNDSIGIISRTYHKCWTVVTCENYDLNGLLFPPKTCLFTEYGQRLANYFWNRTQSYCLLHDYCEIPWGFLPYHCCSGWWNCELEAFVPQNVSNTNV